MKSNCEITMDQFFSKVHLVLTIESIELKCNLAQELKEALLLKESEDNEFSTFVTHHNLDTPLYPGHPSKPNLVEPKNVPKRKLTNSLGHAGLIHALAHIEFNAINLALDACLRFQGMPFEYYCNWIEVASDEAYHFQLLNNHLKSLGFCYGDFDAHSGLWEAAIKSKDDVLSRMAYVGRVFEAQGIDQAPRIKEQLEAIQDYKGAEVLDIIGRDEIKHVQYGDYWFKYECQRLNLEPEATFFAIMDKFNAPSPKPPLNFEGRLKAGFSESEIQKLKDYKKSPR